MNHIKRRKSITERLKAASDRLILSQTIPTSQSIEGLNKEDRDVLRMNRRRKSIGLDPKSKKTPVQKEIKMDFKVAFGLAEPEETETAKIGNPGTMNFNKSDRLARRKERITRNKSASSIRIMHH